MSFPLPPGLETPALVVDEGRLEANLTRMAQAMADRGVALRPHAKTHKSVEVARRQRALGASGLAVATIGEAEVFADAGFDDLVVAYPLAVGGRKASRLAALAARTRLLVGVDSVDGARALAAASPGVGVVLELDCGLRRSGVRVDEVARLAREASRCGLDVAGVFTYGGHAYAPGMAGRAADDERTTLDEATALLEAEGHEVRVVSAGSTPTALLSAGGRVTEERPGIYPFNDAQQVTLGVCGLEDVALVVAATVVSVGAGGRVVLDAGSKVLGPDRPSWVPGHGMLADCPDAVISGLWEHHAVVDVPEGSGRPRLGDVVAVVPNHVCTAVNLADEYVVVREGTDVGTWPVDARGRNR